MDSADSIKPRRAHCYLMKEPGGERRPKRAVFLAVMIGGALMGALGALIAIPVAETLRLLFEELRGHQVEAGASPPTVSARGWMESP